MPVAAARARATEKDVSMADGSGFGVLESEEEAERCDRLTIRETQKLTFHSQLSSGNAMRRKSQERKWARSPVSGPTRNFL